MRFSRFIFLVVVLVCILFSTHPFAHAQALTSITATTVDAGSGPVTGTLCAKAVNQYGTPISVTKSGGGIYLKDRPFCQILTAGVLAGALNVPNSVTDSAPGHAYDLVVYDTVSGIQTDLGDIYGISGTSWSLDNYQPSYTVPTTSAFTFTTGTGAAPTSCAEPAIYAQKATGGATVSICNEGVFVPIAGGGSVAALPAGVASDGAGGLAATGQIAAGAALQAGTGSAATVITSGQGVWQRKGVVLWPNPQQINPRLTGEPMLIAPEGNPLIFNPTDYPTVWKMWYSDGGTRAIFYAESVDGVNWKSYVGPQTYGAVVNWHQRPNVIKNGSTYYLFASPDDQQIDVYSATDGVTFSLLKSNAVGTGSSNSGGVMVGSTLYLFAEHTGNPLELFTSTDFQNFTSQGSLAGTVGYCGPSTPYQINGSWYMWVHDCGAPKIYRISAPALTGPWAKAATEYSGQTWDENSVAGQTADPFVIEVSGKTYLYYTNNLPLQGGSPYSQLKLAIADMPLASLIKTNGGVAQGSIEAQTPPIGVDYDGNTIKIDLKHHALVNGDSATFSGKITSNNAIADWFTTREAYTCTEDCQIIPGTNQPIILKINGSEVMRLDIFSNLRPFNTNGASLGDAGAKFNNIYGSHLYATDSAQIGSSGSTLSYVLKTYFDNVSWSSIPAQTCTEQSVTMTNANQGEPTTVSPLTGLGSTALQWSGYSASPGNITIRLCNISASAVAPSTTSWGVSQIK